MDETITLDHLVLYLYNETQMTESVLVQQLIDRDEEAAEEYRQLMEARRLIQQDLLAPSKNSIDAVLAYSHMTAPLQRA